MTNEKNLNIVLPFANIAINHSVNIREEAHGVWPIEQGEFNKKEQKELVESFVLRGIDIRDEPLRVTAVGKDAGDLTKEDIDACIAAREQFLKDLQGRSATDQKSLLLHFVLSFLWKQADGKFVKPTHRLIAGFQRTTAYVLSRVALLQDALTENKKLNVQDFLAKVCAESSFSAAVYKFKTVLEMKISQMEENQLKAEGSRKMGFAQLLKLADEMMDENLKQSDLRRHFNVGMGQKLWGILTLDRRFKKLELVKRLQLAKTEPNWIDWGKIPQDLSSLVRESDADWVQKNNDKYNDEPKKQVMLLDEQKLNKKFTEFTNKEGSNDKKIMSKDGIDNLRNQNRNELVKLVADAIYTDSTVKLTSIARPVFPATNALLEMQQTRPEHYPQVQAIILKLASMEPAAFVKNVKAVADLLKLSQQDVKNATVETAATV